MTGSELGPASLRVSARVERASPVGQLFVESPRSLTQMLAGFGWSVVETRALPDAFLLTLEKPRIGG